MPSTQASKSWHFALADVLAVEIGRLANAGCRWIQVDEPLFARSPDKALAYGVEALDRCFAKVPAEVNKVVHVCCGYPSDLDLAEYPKADPGAYFDLAAAIDQSSVDAISLEDAHRHNNLALLERFVRTTVVLGAVNIARTRVETTDEIRGRLITALDHIDRDRLIAGPDCGLIMLDRQTAVAKLRKTPAPPFGVTLMEPRQRSGRSFLQSAHFGWILLKNSLERLQRTVVRMPPETQFREHAFPESICSVTRGEPGCGRKMIPTVLRRVARSRVFQHNRPKADAPGRPTGFRNVVNLWQVAFYWD